MFIRARALLLRTLGDSAARQSATDIRPLFLSTSASSPLLSRPLFPFSLSLHPNQKRSWPNEQVAKRTSTPGCGELTRVLHKATYVRFPFLLFLSCGSLFFFITCRSDIGSRISVFLGNRSRELTRTVTSRDVTGFLGWMLTTASSCRGGP